MKHFTSQSLNALKMITTQYNSIIYACVPLPPFCTVILTDGLLKITVCRKLNESIYYTYICTHQNIEKPHPHLHPLVVSRAAHGVTGRLISSPMISHSMFSPPVKYVCVLLLIKWGSNLHPTRCFLKTKFFYN